MDAIDQKKRCLAARLEIAVLIKNAVVGQIVLMIDARECTLADDCRRIIDVMVTVHKTDDGDKPCQVPAGSNEFI